MTTQEPTETTEATEPQEDQGLANVRAAKERSDERAEGYRKQLVELNLGNLGLSAEEGLGIAIAEAYKGEPTLDAIAAFAEEKYKYQAPAAGVATSPSGVTSPAEVLQQQTEEGQQVVAAAQTPVPDNVVAQRAQAAEAVFDGDPEKALTPFDITSGIEAKMDQFTQ